MKFLIDWIPDNLLQALGWTLVHSMWQLALVATLLWVVLKVAHRVRPAIKYGLAVGALMLSLALSLGTFVYEYQPASAAKAMLSSADLQFILANPSILRAEAGVDYGVGKVSFWIEQNIPLLVNFWFLGAILFLFRMVNSLSEIRSLRQSSSPVTDFQLQKTLYRLMGKMGIKADIELRMSASGVSPLTFGTFKPVILFPAGLLFHLSPAQLEAIIAHELAHVKRNDYLANLLLSGLEVAFFFHPCYWWMNTTVKELRENAADDLVMKVGIEPKTLATSLAEVLNFAQQNPPELALAAGKHRNPTLQRIKRILGYPAQNYPQTPIISIPMLLTLFLSVGLMASAQQDAPQQTGPIPSKSQVAEIEPTFLALANEDTVVKKTQDVKSNAPTATVNENTMVFTNDKGKTYKIQGDLLISKGDTVKLSPKAKAVLNDLQTFNSQNMPHLEMPIAPILPVEMALAPIPAFDFTMTMPVMSPIPPMPLMDMTEFSMPPLDMNFAFAFDQNHAPFHFDVDTTKMSKEEKEKWAKEMDAAAKEWSKKAEEVSKEWEKNSAEWQAKFEKEFQPKMKEFESKMAEWQAAQGPKMAEFEAKMDEWQAENGPKMKEFEAKMQAWQAAQEPKMKEFELKMKAWETAQKPKMEEFERKMEVWQKEHQAKMAEFQKLLQEEMKKDDNN